MRLTDAQMLESRVLVEVDIALKAQMERVIGVIEEKMEKLTSQINSYQCPQQVPTAYLAQLYALDALKAELEGENE